MVVNEFGAIASTITHVNILQAHLLGTPIGSLEETNVVLSKKISDFQRLSCRLTQPCAHDTLYLSG
jgi:hypothetical protein